MDEKMCVYYTLEEMKAVENYIESALGITDESGFDAHEIQSDYIHSDVLIRKNENGETVFASLGMGAREMKTPREGYERTELVMFCADEIEVDTEESFQLASTVNGMTKYPFLNDTWFGTGHTVSMSQSDKEKYGYDAFALLENTEPTEVTDLGVVHFLTMIPIYEDEREWIMENNTFDYLELLFEEFGRDALYVDKPREHFIPVEEQTENIFMKSFMNMFDIDEETYYRFVDFIESMRQEGEEVTYDMMGKWIEENRPKQRTKNDTSKFL